MTLHCPNLSGDEEAHAGECLMLRLNANIACIDTGIRHFLQEQSPGSVISHIPHGNYATTFPINQRV